MKIRYIFIAVGAFVVGFLLAWVFVGGGRAIVPADAPEGGEEVAEENDDDSVMEGEVMEKAVEEGTGEVSGSVAPVEGMRVVVSDQEAGMQVVLGAVQVFEDSWIVVHEDRDGMPGNILGAQRFRMGDYPDGGTVDLLRGTVVGGTYYAMVHMDDGVGGFDHMLDLPRGDVPVVSFVAQ
jgi:hypothetical protein